ncbi:ATP-grasp domain-containing protein [Acidiferrimicrobium sp. IK]|nr:biotin carboxylase N-terminal domain-containing protein [Acidiferrimicrobium sp. IK]MCU4185940.1 ATP-grasp domain-containing protein [Acidiferrimicrobium sp. IK]
MKMLLVANRGEIARRIFRTCREMGIATAAVYSDADADALHASEADVAVRLPGVTPAETYLNPDLLVTAAIAVGADSVHPGYGFLSENAAFARACTDKELTFVGPPAEAIEAMGSKLTAKTMMSAAGVPTLPWTDVSDLEEDKLRRVAEDIGYPLLVKASSGGGGRGMRQVLDGHGLFDAVTGAKREAAAAFSDATVFLERLVVQPRHVEIQVLADSHGSVVALFERECSIQRRYQKIIEESPSPAVDDALRERMGNAAVSAARAVGYVGAGTVEFVMDTDGHYYFLEMNTRLQVEHPVTELVTGIDLVRQQLLVAMGEPVPAEVSEAVITGHAVEARLYAENPVEQFLPQTGTLETFDFDTVPGVRIDSGVESGSSISQYYDPMVAKVISWAPNRAEAIRKLSTVLAGARIHGLVTNRDLLVRILRHPEFLAGDTDTGFLVRHPPAELGKPLAEPEAEQLHAVAASLALLAQKRANASVQQTVPAAWRNNASQMQNVTFQVAEAQYRVDYVLAHGTVLARVNNEDFPELLLRTLAPERVILEIDGVRTAFEVTISGEAAASCVVHVDSRLGYTKLIREPRFGAPSAAEPGGSLTAPMPGSVVRVLVEVGEEVIAGQPLLILEAMKMEHTVTSPYPGLVREVAVNQGAAVRDGEVLVVLEQEDEGRPLSRY